MAWRSASQRLGSEFPFVDSALEHAGIEGDYDLIVVELAFYSP